MKNTHVHVVGLGDMDYPNQSSTGCSGSGGDMLSLTSTGPASLSLQYEQLSKHCFDKIVML